MSYQKITNLDSFEEEGHFDEGEGAEHRHSDPLFISIATTQAESVSRSQLHSLLLVILPSFIALYLTPQDKPRQIRKTSYLDGLRGVAAIVVVVHHQFINHRHWYVRPFTFGPFQDGDNPQDWTSPLQLPIVRLFYSVRGMVPIFFIISGYVLTVRPLKIIRGTKEGILSDVLFSSIFRRAFRLFLPCIVGVMMGSLQLWALGGALWPYDLTFAGYISHVHETSWRFVGALWTWEMADWELHQFWTIPVEYMCSMVLFVIVMGTSELRVPVRIASMIGLMSLIMTYYHWGLFCFFAGCLFAEIEEILEERRQSYCLHEPFDEEKGRKAQDRLGLTQRWASYSATVAISVFYNLFWNAVLILSCIVLSWPDQATERDPLLNGLARGYPNVFWTVWGALFFFICVLRLSWLRYLFTTRIALYFGDISYAMYICHYAHTSSLGSTITRHADWIFGEGRVGHLTRFIGFAYEFLLMMIIVIWQSDLFWRYVDIPTVKFAKWLEQICRRTSDSDKMEKMRMG